MSAILIQLSRAFPSRFSATSVLPTAAYRSRAAQSRSCHPLTLRSINSDSRSSIWRQCKRSYSQKPPSSPNPTSNLHSPEPHSLTARLKKLSREYGWTVIGVYLALAVVDLPFCFLTVKYVGAERVAHAENVILSGAKSVIQKVFPDMFQKQLESRVDAEATEASEDASEAESSYPSFWTQVALAFVIHKSFIFVRVPLTAAITPKVVRTLRGWGYDIGKRRPRSS